MRPKPIAIITENALDFHLRAACLWPHVVEWVKPSRLDGRSAESKLELVIIEADEKAVEWLQAVRGEVELPVIVISYESQADLQAQCARCVNPNAQKLEGNQPILEFGKHGVFYLGKPRRLQAVLATVAACGAVVDFGDTRRQLQLRQAVNRLRRLRHGAIKRIDGCWAWLDVLNNGAPPEEWAEFIADVQNWCHELEAPLEVLCALTDAQFAKQHFPELVQLKPKLETWLKAMSATGSSLRTWNTRHVPAAVRMRRGIMALYAMKQIFTKSDGC